MCDQVIGNGAHEQDGIFDLQIDILFCHDVEIIIIAGVADFERLRDDRGELSVKNLCF